MHTRSTFPEGSQLRKVIRMAPFIVKTCCMAMLLALIARGGEAQATSPRPLESRDFFVAGVPDTASGAALERVFGRRDSVTTYPDPIDSGHVIEQWFYPGLMAEAFERSRQGRAVALLSPKWSTSRGLRVGDVIARAEALYGRHPLVPIGVPGEGEWIIDDPNAELHYFRVLFHGGKVYRIMFGWTSD